MASLISWMIVSNLPSKALFNLAQEIPSRVKMGRISTSSFSIRRFSMRCLRISSNHLFCSSVKGRSDLTFINALFTLCSMAPAGSLKKGKCGKDGKDRGTLSKIQLFDNWGAGLDKAKTNLTRREKSGEGDQVGLPRRSLPTR